MRNNVEEFHHKIYSEAVEIAASVDVEPKKPRTHTGRQSKRANAMPEGPVSDPVETYFRINLTIPLLDGALTEFRTK